MRPIRNGVSTAHVALIVGALALTGCVPGAYVYDYPPDGYYSGGYGYYSTVQPGYYAESGYYGRPGYYGPTGHPPPVVYYDHDHDRDRMDRGRDGHDAHDGRNGRDGHDRDGHDGRNERGTEDGHAVRPPPHAPPRSGVTPPRPPPGVAPRPGSGSSMPVPRGRNPCAGNNCRPSGEASEPQATSDHREPGTPTRQDRDKRAGGRRVLE